MSAEQYGTIQWAFFRTDADGRRLFCPTGRSGRVAYIVESEEAERRLVRAARFAYAAWFVLLIASMILMRHAFGAVGAGCMLVILASSWVRRALFWPITRGLRRVDSEPLPQDKWPAAARSMNPRLIVLFSVF